MIGALAVIFPDAMVGPGDLVAGHAEIRGDCFACHTAFAGTQTRKCTNCHEPARIGHADAPTDCTACHTAPDDAPHKAVTDACASCHGLDRWTPAMFRHDRLASATKRDCAGCHAEAEPADALHRGTKGRYCGACHGTDAWEPARFDHWREFALVGPHNADCETCHRSNDFQQYTCYGCHEHARRSVRFAHEGEVAATSDCARCHTGAHE